MEDGRSLNSGQHYTSITLHFICNQFNSHTTGLPQPATDHPEVIEEIIINSASCCYSWRQANKYHISEAQHSILIGWRSLLAPNVKLLKVNIIWHGVTATFRFSLPSFLELCRLGWVHQKEHLEINGWVSEQVLNVPLDTYIISKTVFPGNQLHWYWQHNIKITQKYQDTQNIKNKKYHQKLKPGLVACYNIRPGNGQGLFLFQHFINL